MGACARNSDRYFRSVLRFSVDHDQIRVCFFAWVATTAFRVQL
ncbi:hypothetical protein I546_3261 [Mycobacterium kansasii 732]|nr:hypothetical protein I546_3261 [Mycobacterium kansasii 732]